MTGRSDSIERLALSLAPRYTLGDEIGRGGMAIVYRAHDIRHDRPVAIKVLMPELVAAVGAERFLREIEVSAKLVHPHIVPLLDSGEVEGLPFFVMPFVSGESLYDRLQRETQLPLSDVLTIARHVATALDFAHEQGIIHRDVKPQNILLAANQALVADFGIALAVASAGAGRITGTGIAVGSPLYMSPEQANPAGRIDRRSDVYSLGCVVYEMLAGEPPFGGATPQAVLARHAVEPVPRLRVVRGTIPDSMQRAIEKALAKVPADRFQTACAFADALERAATQEAHGGSRLSTRRWVARGIGVLGTAIALLVAGLLVFRPGPTPGQRQQVPGVAVMPFSISGADDTPAISPMALAQLISERIGGDGGLPVIDPVEVAAALQSGGEPATPVSEPEAIASGRAVGASAIVRGTVISSGGRLVLGGALLSVPDGRVLARSEDVSGSQDSLLEIVDRFAMSLLLARSSEPWRSVSEATTDVLPALKAYLAGFEMFRRGRYQDAVTKLEGAVQLDSAFPLAYVLLGSAHDVAGNEESSLRALNVAWSMRDRLPRADSVYLLALLGRRHPQPTSYADRLRLWEWVSDSLPNRWLGSYQLGDMLFHWGGLLGRALSAERAERAFRRTLAADSGFAPALERLVSLAAARDDTATTRRLADTYRSANPDADHMAYGGGGLAVAPPDTALRDTVVNHLQDVPSAVLEQIIGVAQLDGVALEDADVAAEVLRSRARTDYALWWSSLFARELALNTGRPSTIPSASAREDLFTVPLSALFRVVEALAWEGDSAVARAAVARLRENADAPLRTTDAWSPQFMAMCAVGLWRLRHGDVDGSVRMLRGLGRAHDPTSSRVSMYIPVCAGVLRLGLAEERHDGTLEEAAGQLDSLMRTGPETNAYVALIATRELAQAFTQLGEPARALAVLQRRAYHYQTFGTAGLSSLLREEGRLAAALGDTSTAREAYGHLLRLRERAEPDARALDDPARAFITSQSKQRP